MLTARNSLVAALIAAGTACNPDYEITSGPVDVDPGAVTECGFSAIPGTKLSEYDCNPVFTSTDETWGQTVGSVGFHASDVLGHPFYQMWYIAQPTNSTTREYGMGYAVSPDGTNWTPHPANPLFVQQPGAWDQDGVASQVVVWDPDFEQYVMAYQGFTIADGVFDAGIWGLGVATSPDGVSWTKHPRNPVINFQDMQGVSPCWPLTVTKATGGFRGYISAQTVDPILGIPLSDQCDIYTMTAIDLGVWSLSASPVLTGGGNTDLKGMSGASVVELDGIQYMFYIGFNEWVAAQGYQYTTDMTLNLATSIDGGMTWNKDPSNPLPVNLTTPGEIMSVSAQVVGSRIHLWIGDTYPGLGSASEGAGAIGYFLYEP